ncbi:MAG: DUF5596 domain-containing protein [Oscillospiraceae bacterium]|nr:DUF5596 domain-containing protein [Oscillospiraceae bacterium]
MEHLRLLDGAGFGEEGKKIFFDIHSRKGEPSFKEKLAKAEEEYKKGDEAFGEYIEGFASEEKLLPQQLTLYIYILFAEKTYEEYQKRGISDKIYFDTMKVFPTVSDVEKARCGVYGIAQKVYRSWVRKNLDCIIYRIGLLEFELKECPIEISEHGVSVGDTVLSVHIPRNTGLREEDAESSYAAAREFFKKYYGMEKCIFICQSWLLHPWMQDFMKEESNIIKFQKKYSLVQVETNYEVARNWIFPHCEGKGLDELPCDTSLRRKAIEYMKKGLPVGTGFGVRL